MAEQDERIAKMETVNDNYDSPWKEAVEHYFPEFNLDLDLDLGLGLAFVLILRDNVKSYIGLVIPAWTAGIQSTWRY